jgi:hypothetical protein
MRIEFLGVRVVGHLNPMTALARKLKAPSHDVVFISILDAELYVRAAQLPFNLILRKGASVRIGTPWSWSKPIRTGTSHPILTPKNWT